MTNPNDLQGLIYELKQIQDDFHTKFGVADIISNSKIYELIVANSLGHALLPKLSGSRDAKDEFGSEYEYKHYKETSSNHTWTFNDYSDNTIESIKKTKSVIFAHLDDQDKFPPIFDWYYDVPGELMSIYLTQKVVSIQNTRKMLNVSPSQIEKEIGLSRIRLDLPLEHGKYYTCLYQIFAIIGKIEEQIGTKNILTSNKFWELLIASITGHKIFTEQKAYDAIDNEGNFYEYKVAKSNSWNFEDISDKVLEKFDNMESVILAKVDKRNFLVV